MIGTNMKTPEQILFYLLIWIPLCHSIQTAPRIITLLETVDVLLDHNATFICEVESGPPALITWTKNNHQIKYYDTRYLTREKGQMLVIPHVTESDNGEYCCLASNGIGEPAKSCGALQLKMKPQIKQQPRNLTLVITSKAVLPCFTLGNPKPEITWLKDNNHVKLSNRCVGESRMDGKSTAGGLHPKQDESSCSNRKENASCKCAVRKTPSDQNFFPMEIDGVLLRESFGVHTGPISCSVDAP